MGDIIVLIPALNPLQPLLQLVEQLKSTAIKKIVIINDGSDGKYASIFEELKQQPHCIVIEHEQNRGKGRALKTGFGYIAKRERKIEGVLIAGAHGQHTFEDVELMIESAKLFSDGIVLGVRQFGTREMPLLSFLGNRTASILFELLFHHRLLDIQSGLRYIPKRELSWVHKVDGEQADFDMNMLVQAIQRAVPIYEIPIGEAKIKKNSIIHYDELVGAKEMVQQVWKTFLTSKSPK